MTRVPRFRDDLTIARAGRTYRVVDRQGTEVFLLSDLGYDIVRWLDGIRDEQDLFAIYATHFDRELHPDDYRGLLDALATQGCLIDDPMVLEILIALREQGVSYRRKLGDRRKTEREAPDRRDNDEAHEAFDHAVLLLNAGYLDRALEAFRRIAAVATTSIRVRTIIEVIETTVRGSPATSVDIDWKVFDRLLGSLLDQGTCGQCGSELEVELGGLNRCPRCLTSYTDFVVGKARGETVPTLGVPNDI